MSAQRLTMFCMVPTPFDEHGAVDEHAFRTHLRRLIDAGLGIYLPSGGAGEAHVLTVEEMGRLCAIGVDEARGKVPLHAGLRESRSAAAMYEIARPAVDAGVDVVQLYQLDAGHGMVPSQREQDAYWRTLLDEIDHPVALSVHYYAAFRATPGFLLELCERYQQIVAVNLVGSPHGYFMQVRDTLPARVALHVALPDAVQFATLGAAGAINPAGNLIPHLCRAVADAYERGDMGRVSEATQAIQRFLNIVQRWAPSTARWVKMGMKVWGLGNGVLRPPYLLPPEDEQAEMAAAFDAIGLREREQDAAERARRG